MVRTAKFAEFLVHESEKNELSSNDLDRFITSHLSQFNDGSYGITTERQRLAAAFIAATRGSKIGLQIIDQVIDRIQKDPFK